MISIEFTGHHGMDFQTLDVLSYLIEIDVFAAHFAGLVKLKKTKISNNNVNANRKIKLIN